MLVRGVFIAYGIVVRSLPYICEWGRMGAPYHESWYTTTALLGAASFLTIAATRMDFLFCISWDTSVLERNMAQTLKDFIKRFFLNKHLYKCRSSRVLFKIMLVFYSR